MKPSQLLYKFDKIFPAYIFLHQFHDFFSAKACLSNKICHPMNPECQVLQVHLPRQALDLVQAPDR